MNNNYISGFLLLVAAGVFGLLAQVLRVRATNIISSTHFTVGTRVGLAGYAIGFAFNSLIPLRLGELARSIWISRQVNNSIFTVLPFILVERSLDILIVCFGALLLLPSTVAVKVALDLLVLFSVIAASLTILTFIPSNKSHSVLTRGQFGRGNRAKFSFGFLSFQQSLRSLTINKLGLSVLHLIGAWLIYFVLFQLTYEVFGISHLDWLNWNLNPDVLGNLNLQSVNHYTKTWLILAIPMLFIGILSLLVPNSSLRIRRLVSGNFTTKGKSGPVSPRKYLENFPKPEALQSKAFTDLKLLTWDGLTLERSLPGGSGAAIGLMHNDEKTHFVRKVVSNESAQKIKEQLDFINHNTSRYFFPRILNSFENSKLVGFDSEYLEHHDSLESIFLSGNQDNKKIFGVVLQALQILEEASGLTHEIDFREASKLVNDLWTSKARGCIRYLELHAPELLISNELRVNGHLLPGLISLLEDFEAKLSDYAPTSLCDRNHGDPTLSNIFLARDSIDENAIRFIDPNPRQTYSSISVDYGKVLQSLYGQYELLFNDKSPVRFDGYDINFSIIPNPSLEAGRRTLDEYMSNRGASFLKECYFMCFIHFVRLLPYRATHDRLRAPIYLARTLQIGVKVLEGDLTHK
jgi:hypothetical protein